MNILETERNFYKNIKILGEKNIPFKKMQRKIYLFVKKKIRGKKYSTQKMQ